MAIRVRQTKATTKIPKSSRPLSSLPRREADRYLVGEIIGSGRDTRVHSAFDLEEGREVALKVFNRNARPLSVMAEVEALSAVQDITAAVTVYDYEVQLYSSFIVTEFIEGVTLRHRLSACGGLSFSTAHNFMLQLCEGLASIYQIEDENGKGAIHGDLKPNNIMIDVEDKVRILDFATLGALRNGLPIIQLTKNMLPYYAPEVQTDMKLGVESDIFAAGIMFTEMLLGKIIMLNNNTLDIDENNLGPNPLRTRAVIVKMTQPDPRKRYQTYPPLIRDLRALVT